MNRLELYISKSTREYKTLVDINGSSAGRGAIADMSAVVDIVDYRQSAKNLFYAVVNVNGGYMIHVIRTIPPTRPWHLDASIFVRAGLDVMAEDLEAVVAVVSEKVLAPTVTQDDMDELRELFAQEYDEIGRKPRVKMSSGNEPAVIRYDEDGGLSLSDLISEGLYNSEWSAYSAVLLLGDGLSVRAGAAVCLDEEYVDTEEEDEMPEVVENKSSDPAPGHPKGGFTYLFSLPMQTPDGRSAIEFEIQSSKPVSRSPISGYAVKGRISDSPQAINRLHKLSSDAGIAILGKLKLICIGFVIGAIVMGVGIWMASGNDDSEVRTDNVVAEVPVSKPSKTSVKADKPKASETKEAPQTAAPQAKNDIEHTEASYYLDSHRVWQRSDMEKIEGLQGLYDDLNSFRYDRITDEWSKKLAASKNFGKVVKAVRQAVGKKSDPRRDAAHNPNYNNKGETSISWLAYTYWIDP